MYSLLMMTLMLLQQCDLLFYGPSAPSFADNITRFTMFAESLEAMKSVAGARLQATCAASMYGRCQYSVTPNFGKWVSDSYGCGTTDQLQLT